MKFAPFPLLKTQRLTLRQLTEADKDAIFFLRSDERVNEFIKRDKPLEIGEAVKFINDRNLNIENGESIYWAICLKEKTDLIGTICLWNFNSSGEVAELGYELHPDFQRQGLMAEAIPCVIKYAFKELDLKILEANTDKDNVRASQLLIKNKFFLLGHRSDEDNPANQIYELKRT